MGLFGGSIGKAFGKANKATGGIVDPFHIFGDGGDGEGESGISRPTFYEDPDYRAAQDSLRGLGIGLIDGKVPDYYKAIGETGSPEFENMLSLTTRDIQKSAAESMAKSGRARGGALPAITAGAVADAATKARYSDYDRSLTGKLNLLKLGTDVTTGVRSSGQTQGAYVNNFNWKDYDAQVTERNYQDIKQAQEDAALGELIGTIASVGLGAATGGMSFGLQGAMAGGLDAFSGGGTNFLGMLNKNPTKQAAGVSSLGAIDDSYWQTPPLSGYFSKN